LLKGEVCLEDREEGCDLVSFCCIRGEVLSFYICIWGRDEQLESKRSIASRYGMPAGFIHRSPCQSSSQQVFALGKPQNQKYDAGLLGPTKNIDYCVHIVKGVYPVCEANVT
jgi:hypothetical protein